MLYSEQPGNLVVRTLLASHSKKEMKLPDDVVLQGVVCQCTTGDEVVGMVVTPPRGKPEVRRSVHVDCVKHSHSTSAGVKCSPPLQFMKPNGSNGLAVVELAVYSV